MSKDNQYKSPESVLSDSGTDNLENLLETAKRQKTLIRAFLIYLLYLGVGFSIPPELKPLYQLIAIPFLIAIVVLTARLSWFIYGKVVSFILTVLSVFPLINVIVVLTVNAKATKIIKANGYQVGLLGADVRNIEYNA